MTELATLLLETEAPSPTDGVTIQLVRGREAEVLLADAAFLGEWAALMEQCPWATAFQSSGYARAWYRVYCDEYSPLLIISYDREKKLQGLLALAVGAGGRVVVAGALQAEYQAWISTPSFGNEFALEAVTAVRRALPTSTLRFKYLPPGAPRDWMSAPQMRKICAIKTHQRPLFRFGDGKEILASLAKGSNKSRIKRLDKLGKIQFTHVTDAQELVDLFPKILPFHESRHLAMRGETSFLNDPRMVEFAKALLQTPGLLHVTRFTTGEQFAAVHMGAISGKEVQLGLIAHNPWLSKHSPGKFQILFLARMLMEQGFEQLDLTAGGDPYKERFANAWDQVHTVTIYPSNLARRKGMMAAGMKDAARSALAMLRLTPNQAKVIAGKIKAVRPAGIARGLRKSLRRTSAMQMYVRELSGGSNAIDSESVHRNELSDLLQYAPVAGELSRSEFMSNAIRRIEEGQQAHTVCENGRLLHAGWLAMRPTQPMIDAIVAGAQLPQESALLMHLQTSAGARRRGLAEKSVKAMICSLEKSGDIRRLCAFASEKNLPAIGLLKKLGFVEQAISCVAVGPQVHSSDSSEKE